MRAYVLIFPFLIIGIFSLSTVAHAEPVTIYSQLDDSGEMLSQQPTNLTASISAPIGNLFLGKDRLSITFTMKDSHASTAYHSPFGGVGVGTCSGCSNLQKYYFTDADRAILMDGQFHTFTVQTGTTTLGIADGETPVYVTFFNLSQYHLGTHLKSNAEGTVPYLSIEAASLPVLPPEPQAPPGSVIVYEQLDKTGLMTNPQVSSQNSYIASANLGNLNLGQGPVYLTFTIKSPYVNATLPQGVCLERGISSGCGYRLQTYYFTKEDRALLADGAFHTFTVLTGTTTSTYADGTQPVKLSFFGLYQIQYGTKVRSNADATIPFLKIKTPPPLIPVDPCVAAGNCVSNVLFLPGIEGSRLYEGTGCGKSAEEKLWEPVDFKSDIVRGVGDGKIGDLALELTGKSACADIYTKDSDIIDATMGGNLYASLISDMNALKSDGTVRDWKPVAYDWRLSLDDLLTKGAKRDGKIYYEEATSTPYIEQTLRALAANSKTGKVTIIAHSNGGLVTKALLNKLGDTETAKLVDKIIMVGVPQSGAPADVASMLVGYGAGIYADVGSLKGAITIVSNKAARAFTQNSPMAYHLLPSQSYFDSVMDDPSHPVASFSGSGYTKEIVAYGNAIGTVKELDDFLLAKDGGRVKPAANNLTSAEVLNSNLIDYANREHNVLDGWVPPASVEVSQIAGWGVDTVAGIDFYTQPATDVISALNPVRDYRPIVVEDGDGTVPVPSALMMATSTNTNVKRYWVDLAKINNVPGVKVKRSHADLFEIPSLQDFIKSVLQNNTSTTSAYISTIQPAPIVESKKLTFYLHSPLTLQLTDASGNVTGLSMDDSITENIPGSTYGEFGEVKYVTVPEGSPYQLTMHGQAEGSFSLDTQETSGGVIAASSTIASVPTTASTTVTMNIPSDISTPATMLIDKNGDGTIDATVTSKPGETVMFDTIPPELQITFSTTTKEFSFIGADDSGVATVTATTTYPVLKKGQKEPHGTATTTVTALDAAGNTAVLTYTGQLPSPAGRDTITLLSLAYNGATTTLATSSLSYKWRANKNGSFKVFASSLQNTSTILESHYRPKKNETVIMTRPQELDDRDDDDDSDVRPVRQTLSGVVIPYVRTEKGSLIIDY